MNVRIGLNVTKQKPFILTAEDLISSSISIGVTRGQEKRLNNYTGEKRRCIRDRRRRDVL